MIPQELGIYLGCFGALVLFAFAHPVAGYVTYVLICVGMVYVDEV